MEGKELIWSIQRRRVALWSAMLVLAGILCAALLSISAKVAPANANIENVSQNESPDYNGKQRAVITAGSAFTFAMSADAVGLDPALVSDGNSLLATNQIYETLVTDQPGGTIPIPGLAESWDVSPNGLTWTFTLRPGIEFHDGTDLDAAAVLFNLQRWWDPANPYHNGSFDYFVYLFGGFKGDPNCLISGLDTIGTSQVQIILKEPHSPLLNKLAIGSFAIASPTAIQAGTLTTTPVGSGPFRFVEWANGDHIRLTGNLAYWGDGPRLETLTFQVIANEADRFAALQANMVQGIGNVSLSYVPTATLDANLQVVWRPALNIGYLGINRSHPPLDNLLVRQAIAHAINKQSIINQHYNAVADRGQVASQLLPPAVWGHDADLADYAYDPVQARSLLAQAGYTNGLTTTLWVMPVNRPYFPNSADIGASMRADLQAVGITTTQVTYSWSTYISKVNNGEADLFMLGWIGDDGSPDNFFYPHLCDQYRRYGPRDDTLCNQLQAARGEHDFNTLVGMYEQAGQRVHDTLPLVPIAHSRTPLILRHNVAGFVPSPMGIESFKGVFFANSWIHLPLVLKNFGP